MSHTRFFLSACFLPLLLALGACSTADPLADYDELTPAAVLELPDARASKEFDPETVSRGRYLVNLLRCGACHTDGALLGEPDETRLLAGSSVGIAYTSPLQDKNPGVVYPANLTPDPDTGLGGWSERQIVDRIRTGSDRHGRRSIPVMPSAAYASIDDDDARAIAAYLRNLPPVRHAVPASVAPGQKARAPFVHFGVYRSKQ